MKANATDLPPPAPASASVWSNSSGSVLIGVIPGGGNGRTGVISGNSFTPLPASAASASASWADDYSGTW